MSDIQNLEIDLDLKENLLVTVTCKQLDNLNLIFNIWNNSIQANLSNYNCRLKALKQDQIPLIQDTNITINNNVVTIVADEQLTTTSGIVKTELQFIDKTTGEKKSTFSLNLKVIASVLEADRTISKATITLLEELDNKLDEIEDIGDILNEATTVKSELETDITTANTAKTNLQTVIDNAANKITEVGASITNATNTKNSLNTSITNANSSKSALDASKTNADNSKVALDASIEEAHQFVEEHSDIENLLEEVNGKMSLYIGETLPINREDNTLYFKVTNTINTGDNNLKVSPTMGIKLI